MHRFHITTVYDKETYSKLKETSRRLDISMGRVIRALIVRHADSLDLDREKKLTIDEEKR